MKWRSLLLVLFATTSVFLSSFGTPEHALAQNASASQSQLRSIGLNVFDRLDSFLNGFPDTSVSSYFNLGSYIYSQFTKTDRINAVRTVSPIIASARNIFTSKYDNGVANLPPESAGLLTAITGQYSFAMQAAASYITSEQAKLPSANNGSTEQALFSAAIKAITDSANNDTVGNNGLPANASIAAKAAEIEKENSDRCSFSFLNTKPFSLTSCVDVFVSWLVKNTLLQFAGFLLWATANLLDFVIKVGILDFSKWAPEGLYFLWQTVRQIVTMFVVFSGLYLGFMYIINKGDEFKRYVPWIVIFGLFVNFSYPITKAAIDVSNIISLNIYASALNTTSTLAGTNTLGNSAGAQIMTSLGLQGLVMSATSDQTQGAAADIKNSINSTPAALLVVGYVIYAAYIFFIASGILMMRTLALSFIIIASPILFVDAVIPKLGEQAQKLRKIFFEQLSVSIVFMVMLYLSIAMTKVFKNLGGGGVTGSSITQIFNVLMMLVLLHIMLKVTKEVSGSIGQMAGNAMGKFGGFAGGAALGLATGGAGLLARNTIGAAAARWSTSESLANQQNTWLGRRKLDLATSLAGSSFDARNTKLMSVAGTMGGLSKGLGVVGPLKTYNEAKKAKDEDVQRRAGLMTNDEARADYLSGRQSTLGSRMQKATLSAAGFTGNDAKTDADFSVEKFKKEDDDMLKKYASSSNDVRETMMTDEKNKQFKERFAKIDAFFDEKTSKNEKDMFYNSQDSDMKDILKKQELSLAMKDTSKKVEGAKTYLGATPEEQTVLLARADDSEKELYAKIKEYQSLNSETEDGINAKINILKGFNNDSLAKAIISNDKLDTLSDKGNQARAVKIQAAYNDITKKQAVSTPEEKVAIEDLSQVDILERLQRAKKEGEAERSKEKEGKLIVPANDNTYKQAA